MNRSQRWTLVATVLASATVLIAAGLLVAGAAANAVGIERQRKVD
jgi:hypothetical protein